MAVNPPDAWLSGRTMPLEKVLLEPMSVMRGRIDQQPGSSVRRSAGLRCSSASKDRRTVERSDCGPGPIATLPPTPPRLPMGMKVSPACRSSGAGFSGPSGSRCGELRHHGEIARDRMLGQASPAELAQSREREVLTARGDEIRLDRLAQVLVRDAPDRHLDDLGHAREHVLDLAATDPVADPLNEVAGAP